MMAILFGRKSFYGEVVIADSPRGPLLPKRTLVAMAFRLGN